MAGKLRSDRLMPTPPDVDPLSAAQLKELVVQLPREVTALKQTVAMQREEIARLKGLKGPPTIKPSGMEQRPRRRRGRSLAATRPAAARCVPVSASKSAC